MITRLLWKTRSSWLNCALRDDEAVYWVSKGHYEAVAVGNWWYWVSRGHLCLYILHKVEISTDVTDASRTDSQTLKDSATQLLIKYKSGALVTQSLLEVNEFGNIFRHLGFISYKLELRRQNSYPASSVPKWNRRTARVDRLQMTILHTV